MAKNFEHLIHKNSSVIVDGNPKLPTTGQIEYGEIAINYAKDKETISIKNSENEIVTFSPASNFVKVEEYDRSERVIASALNDLNSRVSGNQEEIIQAIIDDEEVTAKALNDLNSRINKTDSDVAKMVDYLEETQEITAAALNDINSRVSNSGNDLEEVTEQVDGMAQQIENISEDIETLRDDIDELDLGTAAALNELDKNLETVTSDMEGLNELLEEIDNVTASALTELDGRVTELENVTVPTTLASLSDDSTHRLVTDTEKATWNGKQDELVFNTAYNASSNKVATMADVTTITFRTWS